MCGKLPAGCDGLVPSGSAPAASGSGVPHHGGATVTAWAGPARARTNAPVSTPIAHRTFIARPPRTRCSFIEHPGGREVKLFLLEPLDDVGAFARLDHAEAASLAFE